MEPAPELVLFMERLYRSFGAFDLESVIDGISREPGSMVVGTAPDEWWVGRQAISAVVAVQFAEMPRVHFDIGETVAWKEGTVGWVASRAMMVIEGMPSIMTRSTLVLREEGAYWRIVHWHLSMPVGNEEALGVGLTTAVEEILTMVQDERPPVVAMAADGMVTIMFTDIEGSTALMESLGEQSWLELLDWHEDAVRKQVVLFGGTVVKGQGDGFMIAFSAPGSAAACAVAIQRSLSRGWAGVPVAARVGIHSGNAKVEGGDFFGRTVVIAARISSAASGSEILTSQVVQEGLGGSFSLGEPRSLVLKGVAGHHSVFPILWSYEPPLETRHHVGK
jgi:class 3 adenylate cyclase